MGPGVMLSPEGWLAAASRRRREGFWLMTRLPRSDVRVWQPFDEMIEAQPDTPAMMKKRNRKEQREGQQDTYDELIMTANEWQGDQIRQHDDGLGADYGHHDGANKESLFPFEDCAARFTTLLHLKQTREDSRATTGRAT